MCGNYSSHFQGTDLSGQSGTGAGRRRGGHPVAVPLLDLTGACTPQPGCTAKSVAPGLRGAAYCDPAEGAGMGLDGVDGSAG